MTPEVMNASHNSRLLVATRMGSDRSGETGRAIAFGFDMIQFNWILRVGLVGPYFY